MTFDVSMASKPWAPRLPGWRQDRSCMQSPSHTENFIVPARTRARSTRNSGAQHCRNAAANGEGGLAGDEGGDDDDDDEVVEEEEEEEEETVCVAAFSAAAARSSPVNAPAGPWHSRKTRPPLPPPPLSPT